MEFPAGRLLAFALVSTLLLSCAAPSGNRLKNADNAALQAGFTPRLVETASFTLQAYVRIPKPAAKLVVYIEGDGLAWVSRNQKSMDPTPISPLALELAALEPAPAVAYLARPCQYIGVNANPNCTDDIWTSARFSEVVISSMSEALDKLERDAGASSLELIGYSGGGGVAALLAARRHDVTALITVAGNLDQHLVMKMAEVSPLDRSLDPADVASSIAHRYTHRLKVNQPSVDFIESFWEVTWSPDCYRSEVESCGVSRGWDCRDLGGGQSAEP